MVEFLNQVKVMFCLNYSLRNQEVERAVHAHVGDLVYGIFLGLFGDAHASSWSWIHSNVVANETNWHPGHPGDDPYR